MAKTAASRNSDRKSGKAWGKNHAPTIKTMTAEQQAHKAQKDAARERRRPVSHERGSNLTMPKITWEWVANTMSNNSQLSRTRRFRTVETILLRERNS